jgi:hypothetical protein
MAEGAWVGWFGFWDLLLMIVYDSGLTWAKYLYSNFIETKASPVEFWMVCMPPKKLNRLCRTPSKGRSLV